MVPQRYGAPANRAASNPERRRYVTPRTELKSVQVRALAERHLENQVGRNYIWLSTPLGGAPSKK
jgi:hypothetical protein